MTDSGTTQYYPKMSERTIPIHQSLACGQPGGHKNRERTGGKGRGDDTIRDACHSI